MQILVPRTRALPIDVAPIRVPQAHLVRIHVRDITLVRPARVAPTHALRSIRALQGIHATLVLPRTPSQQPIRAGLGIIHARCHHVAELRVVFLTHVVWAILALLSILVQLRLVRLHQAIHVQQQTHVPLIIPVAQVTRVRLTKQPKMVEKHLIQNRPGAHFRGACLRKTRGCNKYGV